MRGARPPRSRHLYPHQRAALKFHGEPIRLEGAMTDTLTVRLHRP